MCRTLLAIALLGALIGEICSKNTQGALRAGIRGAGSGPTPPRRLPGQHPATSVVG
jgi:hypothetical protein